MRSPHPSDTDMREATKVAHPAAASKRASKAGQLGRRRCLAAVKTMIQSGTSASINDAGKALVRCKPTLKLNT